MNKPTAFALLLLISFTLFIQTCTFATYPQSSWTTKNPLPTPRTGLSVAVINEKIYAIGGYPDFNVTEEYDPKTDT